MERRKFTRAFKLEAVCLIKDRGVSYAQASQDLTALHMGVAEAPLCNTRRWYVSRVSTDYPDHGYAYQSCARAPGVIAPR